MFRYGVRINAEYVMSINYLEPTRAGGSTLSLDIAQTEADILAAQRLRYLVFHDEMGARLESGETGFDQDMFDPHCDHLVVRDERSDEVIGTYRILNPAGAKKAGGFYSETEFDLARLEPLLPATVEVGRSCIHPDYRNGAVLSLLWSGLIQYMIQRCYRYAMGCASIPLKDGGHEAASMYTHFVTKHLSPEPWRVYPFSPLPLTALRHDVRFEIPPLLKGYTRLGANVCGEPALDLDFNTADVFILFPLAAMNPRYAKHLVRS